MSLGTTKSIASLQAEASTDDGTGLRRVLTATNLTMLGVGAIIGAGIFVLTGTAAHRRLPQLALPPGSIG